MKTKKEEIRSYKYRSERNRSLFRTRVSSVRRFNLETKKKKSIIVHLSLGVYTVQLSGYRHKLNQRIIDFIINQF